MVEMAENNLKASIIRARKVPQQSKPEYLLYPGQASVHKREARMTGPNKKKSGTPFYRSPALLLRYDLFKTFGVRIVAPSMLDAKIGGGDGNRTHVRITCPVKILHAVR